MNLVYSSEVTSLQPGTSFLITLSDPSACWITSPLESFPRFSLSTKIIPTTSSLMGSFPHLIMPPMPHMLETSFVYIKIINIGPASQWLSCHCPLNSNHRNWNRFRNFLSLSLSYHLPKLSFRSHCNRNIPS